MNRKTLKLPTPDLTEDNLRNLQQKNVELLFAIEKLCEAVTNHQLNTKCASAADVVLWSTVEGLFEFK